MVATTDGEPTALSESRVSLILTVKFYRFAVALIVLLFTFDLGNFSMRVIQHSAAFLGGCLLLALVGCGSDDGLGRRAISGTVTLNGTDLAEGSITFEPVENSTTSSGSLIADGKYSISKAQGLPPGKYRVVVNAIKPGTGMTLPDGKFPGEEVGTPQVEMIPPMWNSRSKQFIEVTESGPTEFTHEITTKGR